ncbi:MAG: hypothetical protein AB1488_07470 [Nitrospirota bacterium]
MMKRFLTIILLITLLSGVYSCGGGGGGSSGGGGGGSGSGSSLVTMSMSSGSWAKVTIERKTFFAQIKHSKPAKWLARVLSAGRAVASVPSPVKYVTFTVRGSDFTELTNTVTVTDWSSDVSSTFDVPNGTGRQFIVEGKNFWNTIIYSGSTTADLIGGDLSLTITASSISDPSKSWSSAVTIDLGSGYTYKLKSSALNSKGLAIVVYNVISGSNYYLYAVRYKMGSGWGTPVRIDNGYASDEEIYAKVGIEDNYQHNDSGGNRAIVIFRQKSSGTSGTWRLYAREFSNDSWGSLYTIDNGASYDVGSVGEVSIDYQGIITVAFTQSEPSDGSYQRLYTKSASTISGLSSASGTRRDANQSSDVTNLQMDYNYYGDIILSFEHGTSALYANVYCNATDSWTGATSIYSGDALKHAVAIFPRLTSSDSLYAMVAYVYDASYKYLYVKKYDTSGGWSSAVSLDSGVNITDTPSGVEVFFSRNYDAIVSYITGSAGSYTLYMKRYNSGATWGFKCMGLCSFNGFKYK